MKSTVRSALIERNPAVCGGAPVIAGTRMPVHDVVQQVGFSGGSIPRMLSDYPDLNAEQVESAIAYYQANQAEIEELLRARRELHAQELERKPRAA